MYEPVTKMHTKNLSTVIGPNILRGKDDNPMLVASTMGIVNMITEAMISECDTLFAVHGVDPWDFTAPDGSQAVSIGVALHTFDTPEEGELLFYRGERLYVLSISDDGWCDACVVRDGNVSEGSVPVNYIHLTGMILHIVIVVIMDRNVKVPEAK